jgi:hypothetical protein
MRSEPLKVAFYGGMFLPLAQHFTSNSGTHTDFFWDVEFFNEVKNQFSEELITLPNVFIDKYNSRGNRLLPGFSPLTTIFKRYDLLIVSEDGVIFAEASGCRYVFVPLGYELARFASRGNDFHGLFFLLRNVFSKYKLRKGVVASKYILANDFPVFRKAISSLHLQNKWMPKFVPTPIDWSVFDSEVKLENQFFQKKTFNIFYPNRIIFTKSEVEEETGQTKNTGLAIWGYKRFKEIARCESKLHIIRRGRDEDLFLLDALIQELDLSESIVWLGENRPLTSEEMKRAYLNANVVLGDFGSLWFGKTTIEAFSQGKPVICKLDRKLVNNLNIEKGIFLVNTADEIAHYLGLLSEMSNIDAQELAYSLRTLYENKFSRIAVQKFYTDLVTHLASELHEDLT